MESGKVRIQCHRCGQWFLIPRERLEEMGDEGYICNACAKELEEQANS